MDFSQNHSVQVWKEPLKVNGFEAETNSPFSRSNSPENNRKIMGFHDSGSHKHHKI